MQRRHFIALLAALPLVKRLRLPDVAPAPTAPPAAIGFLYGDSDYEDFDFSDGEAGHAYAIRHEFWNATHGDITRH